MAFCVAADPDDDISHQPVIRGVAYIHICTAPISANYAPGIETAKLNGFDPQAWLTDVLPKIADTTITHLEDLMP